MHGITCAFAATLAAYAAVAGTRPYEMEWAGRTQDDRPILLVLDDVAGWQVGGSNSVATLTLATERTLFSTGGVMRLVYRATGPAPLVTFAPPKPVHIAHSFDVLGIWVWGNNIWGHHYDKNGARVSTPTTILSAVFREAGGGEFSVPISSNGHLGWHLLLQKLSPEVARRTEGGVDFVRFELTGGTNEDDRLLEFADFSATKEAWRPLSFKARPKRGVTIFPDQPVGLNTGEGTLPFPTTPDTIVPPDSVDAERTLVCDSDGMYRFVRKGVDGTLEVRLPPKAGSWEGMAFRWNNSPWFPCGRGGGFFFAAPKGGRPLVRAASEKTDIRREGDAVIYKATLAAADGSRLADVEVRFRLVGKSLVSDLRATGTLVREVRFGEFEGLEKPWWLPVPYISYRAAAPSPRPCVRVSTLEGRPFFCFSQADWTQSNSSRPFTECVMTNGVLEPNGPAMSRRNPSPAYECAGKTGGTRYVERTDGTYNECCERFVRTFSPRFEDVLPNIPNPPTPYRKECGTRVWTVYSSYNRAADAAYWRAMHRRGLRNVLITDWEMQWRDSYESYTYRTDGPPGRGGDEGLRTYSRILREELGYRYGPYNNFTDYAPINAYWDQDRVARSETGGFLGAWFRCYAPKSAWSVNVCEELTSTLKEKFGFDCAYVDVHSLVAPSGRTDYDARVPGAGVAANTFYQWGEIMLMQKRIFGGPVYSEGGIHWIYSGLTDGNYAQDQQYAMARSPWLVDFDLRRIHPLAIDFGMGPDIYKYAGEQDYPDGGLDRYMAATVAFGHVGMMVHGPRSYVDPYRTFKNGSAIRAFRSYGLLQALGAKYSQTNVSTIAYLDAAGRAKCATDAIADGSYRRSQIVTKYEDGTVTAVNGNASEPMAFSIEGRSRTLPVNGFWGRSGDGQVETFAGEIDGHRAEWCVSPEYIYLNGRGVFTRVPEIGGSDGVMMRYPEKDGVEEVVPFAAKTVELPYVADKVVALGEQREELAKPTVVVEGGRTRITTDPKAVSYMVYRPPVCKQSLEGDESWAGIRAHPAVVNPVGRAADDPDVLSLRGEWDFKASPPRSFRNSINGTAATGNRQFGIFGLDVMSDLPESNALLDGIIEYLLQR